MHAVVMTKLRNQSGELAVTHTHAHTDTHTHTHRTRLQLDMDVCGMEEALSVLTQYVSTLQSTQSEKRQRLDILAEKKRRVGQFTETAVS